MKIRSWMVCTAKSDDNVEVGSHPAEEPREKSTPTPTQPSQPSVTSLPTRARMPLTQDRLGELLAILLKDVASWATKYGYEHIPPIEILRQVTRLGEAVGYAQGREGRDF